MTESVATIGTQPAEAINKYIKEVGGDGHTIFKHEYIRKLGFTDEFVNELCYDHESGQSYKETIFDTESGNPFKSCWGVYSLDLLYALARDIKADTSDARKKMGRGWQARELVKAIKAVIEED